MKLFEWCSEEEKVQTGEDKLLYPTTARAEHRTRCYRDVATYSEREVRCLKCLQNRNARCFF